MPSSSVRHEEPGHDPRALLADPDGDRPAAGGDDRLEELIAGRLLVELDVGTRGGAAGIVGAGEDAGEVAVAAVLIGPGDDEAAIGEYGDARPRREAPLLV